MRVLEYLNGLTHAGASCFTALGILEECYGVKWKQHQPTGLFVLNYCQINSSKHKFDQIVRECRSLVLEVVPSLSEEGDEVELFKVVSRSFDRFFNIFEQNKEPVVDNLSAVEKMDGSLVNLFHVVGKGWLYRTKSMIMPETNINGFDTTWKEVIEEALGYPKCCEGLDSNLTYIFEVTSPENRVVVRYEDRRATLLAVRNNEDGTYQ